MTVRAVIAQSGGPSRVINATLVGAIVEAANWKTRITDFWGSKYGPEGLVNENFIDLYKQSSQTLELVSRTPGAALGSSRKKIGKDISEEQVLASLRKHNIRYFFYIGGNDSAENARSVKELANNAGYDLTVMHLPKTIDNDIRNNDHTPGYGSAALYVASTFMGTVSDAKSLPGIMINIVMGRDAGYLAAAASLPGKFGADLIYVPEFEFRKERFVQDVLGKRDEQGYAVVSVSEGVRDINCHPIGWDGVSKDSHGNAKYSGSAILAKNLEEMLKTAGYKGRLVIDTLGYPQRNMPLAISEQDYDEACLVGSQGFDAALKYEVSGSITIQRVENKPYKFELKLLPLKDVAKLPRMMPQTFMNSKSNYVNHYFLEHAVPLIGSLPTMGWLENHRVELK